MSRSDPTATERPLTSKKAVDEMINKLGNEGVEAVTGAISEHFSKTFTVDDVKKK